MCIFIARGSQRSENLLLRMIENSSTKLNAPELIGVLAWFTILIFIIFFRYVSENKTLVLIIKKAILWLHTFYMKNISMS